MGRSANLRADNVVFHVDFLVRAQRICANSGASSIISWCRSLELTIQISSQPCVTSRPGSMLDAQ